MKKVILWAVLALLPLIVHGCGGGSSGGGQTATTAITGAVSKGPINGGTVKIFEITTSAHIGRQLDGSQNGAGIPVVNGSFTANVGSYKGAIFATMSGGTYTDEATGQTTALSQKLHAATYIATPKAINLAITPLTELAWRRMQLRPTDMGQNNIDSANTLISTLYLKGLPAGSSIISTLPADVLPGTTATDPARIGYGLALATVSDLMNSLGYSLEQVLTIMGDINPYPANAIYPLQGTLTDANVLNAMAVLPASTYLQSGIAETPMKVTLTPSTSGVIANNADTITFTAAVKGLYDIALSGTSVTFAVTSGTATFANGSTTQTVTVDTAGTPSTTVALKSSVVQTNPGVTVTATAGAIKTSTAVVFGHDPASPATMNLSASPTSVYADSSTAITVSATVLNYLGADLAGVPVTFAVTSGIGTLSASSATTNSSGVASITVTSGTAGSVTISATAGTVTKSIPVIFTPDPAAPATVAITTTPSTLAADGTASSIIGAIVRNYNGTLLPNITVTFAVTSGNGTLSATSATTDSNGSATVALTSSTVNSVTVTATAGGKSGSASVNFTAP
ncbi:Ig-like domain-containing protein [Geobacter sp. AOG2]|uniref:Ig-like domain-containing protein n=1 Tax=Geobacter sp. AOG2 TaxID=1566347 RepID=UPI001CC4F64C|nr:Ig-like domain-containing protein [Geobacter sp. AOG2]GFE62104.1 hypothetical protein AOG2_26920 [Geobacter sp. AOG2]